MENHLLGISGSPVKNSNTDRLVNAILDSSGLESEFVKLSRINVRPWKTWVRLPFLSRAGNVPCIPLWILAAPSYRLLAIALIPSILTYICSPLIVGFQV